MDRLELLNLRNRYVEIYATLEEISIVNLFQRRRMLDNDEIVKLKKSMDLVEMNHWLLEVINFYGRNNVEISYRDFTNMFDSKTPTYRRTNEIIDKYMRLFFENINNLDSHVFSELIFSMKNDIGLLVSDDNPIIEEIIMAINKINSQHKSIFNHIIRESVNKKIEGLGIRECDFDDLDSTLNEVYGKIVEIDKEIQKLDEEEKRKKEELGDEQIMNLNLNKLCMLITQNKYNNMDDDTKKNLMSKITKIMEMIIKLRIFQNIREDYLRYSVEADYASVLKNISDVEVRSAGLRKKIDSEIDNKKDAESYFDDRKSLFDFGFKKRLEQKVKESQEIDGRILSLGRELIRCNELIVKTRKNYLVGFYNKYGDISKLEEEYNIKNMMDNEKLFGVFDIRKLPPSNNSINEQFIDVGVMIPDVDSPEFKEISELALNIMAHGFSSGTEFVFDNQYSEEIDGDLEQQVHHKR